MIRPVPLATVTLAALVTLAWAAPARAATDELAPLIQRAIAQRNEGDLEGSLSTLRRAYRLKPLPVLLNNIATILEQLGRYAEAADALRRVIEDDGASDKLRRLDRQRLGRLAPKLARAWLALDVRPHGASVVVGGAPWAGSAEIGLDAGRRAIELVAPRSDELVLRFVDLRAGLRTKVTENLSAPKLDDVWLFLPQKKGQIATLSVDGHPVTADPDDLRSIRLRAGSYRITATDPTGATQTASVTIEAGQSRWFLSPGIAVDPSFATAPPSAGAGFGTYAGITGGAVLVAVGAGLVVWAESDRSTVLDAPRDDQGVITGITQVEAMDLETRANRSAIAGVAAIAIGCAALAATLLWSLADGPGGDAPAGEPQPPAGLAPRFGLRF